uniref:Reverse transcriptase domain-containing protein n=1 Tax=Ascaris lumbricoides TaxID=6252 RepID=A0A0M3IPT2_ASCLU
LKWLRCFLVNLCFTVKVAGSSSGRRHIISAIPQGSVLGPLLFILCINDVSDKISSVCKLFADDLKIYRPLHDPAADFHVLHSDLAVFGEWSKSRQLDVSHDTCRILHVNYYHECFLRSWCKVLAFADDGIRDLGIKIFLIYA